MKVSGGKLLHKLSEGSALRSILEVGVGGGHHGAPCIHKIQ